MAGAKAAAVGLVAIVGMLLLGAGIFGGYAGAVAVDIEENGPLVPAELEAIYRQVERETAVPWEAVAAWDGAENRFALPISSIGEIFREKVEALLDYRRRAGQDWCKKHPGDTSRCPSPEPQLTPDEQVRLWSEAGASWRSIRREHIRSHAARLHPFVAELDHNPEAVFRRFLVESTAIRAGELFDGYQLLLSLDADEDAVMVDIPPWPENWVPTDGFVWPAAGPIVSRFGIRDSPIDGVRRLHPGIDLAIPSGTTVRASKAGTVVRAGWDTVYGQVVVIDHQDGYQSLYAHASVLKVGIGQAVQQGQVVALSGSTGYSTGPHLHFEIHYRGTPVDPLLVLTQSP